jgi:S1-C subfamily serine protease
VRITRLETGAGTPPVVEMEPPGGPTTPVVAAGAPAARPAAPAAGPAAPAARPAAHAVTPEPTPGGPAELAPGQKVGARTVAFMIEQALARAQQKQGAVGRGTAFMKSIVGQAVTSSTRTFKLVISLLVALLLGGTGAAIYFQRERDAGQRAERDRLVGQIAALSRQIELERAQTSEQLTKTEKDRTAERAEQQARLEALSQKLNQLQKGGVGESIAAENHDAVFLLAASLGQREAPFCTGFAIRKNLLATNAHCVRAAEQLVQRGATLSAILNGDGRRRFPVARMVRHPAYRDKQLGSDVGLMQVRGDLPRLVTLADAAALRRVRQGSPMYTIGFPGSLAKPSQPDATLTQGIISRVMTFEKTPGRFEDTRLLQHTAYISQGTSGSPIFDANGKVIGVNAGGFTTRQPVGIGSPRTAQVIPVLITLAAPGYNFAMRIDLVTDLLAIIGER